MAEGLEQVLSVLVDSLRVMGPYVDDVVLAGAFVVFMYRRLDWARAPRHDFLLTKDVDWALPNRLPIRQQPLRRRFDEMGFTVVLSRDTTPPVQFFQRTLNTSDRLAEVYVECLTPLTGRPTDRGGRPRTPQEVRAQLNAQALRYLDLLFVEPLRIDAGPCLDLEGELLVRIPNPAAFVIQKLLTCERRPTPEKRDRISMISTMLLC